MSSREAILGKLRGALAAGGAMEDERRAAVDVRLTNPRVNVIPARGQLDYLGQVDLFCRMAESVQATVARVDSNAAVPAAVTEHLRRHNLPAQLRMGADPRLAALPWSDTQLEVRPGPSDGNDAVGLSHAEAGVAETGTLVLLSGPDNPTTINFLPDTHIVVLRAADIVGDYESVWRQLRDKLGPGVMPRLVNMITGPSRSADIEQTLLLGAHGPRALHIVLVG
ncbi:MAG TPA: LUD domain-containing protein [Afifellaceae bacterium]|nr:LUD domain-containing protein [Afifellaceae bacterium]